MTALVVIAAVLALTACSDLREVRKRLEGAQEPSQGTPTEITKPPASRAPAPATAQPRAVPSPAPGTVAIPGPGAGAPLPRVAPETTQLPGVHLTPPPGVVPVTRVAILLPLSGDDAKLGQALLNAAQLALFSLAGDGFALLPVDTHGTPDGAAAAAHAALEDGARLILGPLFASSVSAVAPEARAAGVQVVAFSNDRSVAGNGVYIMGFTPETQIDRITAYAAGRGVRRIAAIVPRSVYGRRVEDSLRAAAAAAGISVSHVVRYVGTDTAALAPIVRGLANYDARHARLLERRRELEGKDDEASKRALKRLEGLDTLGDVDFDAVLLPQSPEVLRVLAPLLLFYDIDPRKVHMLGTAQWDEPILATEPSLFGGWFPAAPPAAQHAFDSLYKKTYGDTPPRLAALAYDATALAAVLVRKQSAAGARTAAQGSLAGAGAPPVVAPPDPFSVDALTAPNGFAGVDGIFRLLPSGLVQRGLAVMEVRHRHFVVVSPAPSTFQKTDTGAAQTAPGTDN